MALLEVAPIRKVSASIRLSDSAANDLNLYAGFIGANADDVVEQALVYVFTKDRDFQDFKKSAAAQKIAPTLRVRKPPANESTEQASRRSSSSAISTGQAAASVAGSKA